MSERPETFQLFIVKTDQDLRESHRRIYLEKIQERVAAPFLFIENLSQINASSELLQSEGHLFYLLFLKQEGPLALLRWEKMQRPQKFSPLFFDFTHYWKKEIPFTHTPFSKSLGVTGNFRPVIVDGTCGTAKDSFLMMSFGCQVWAWEKSKLLSLLLEDAYQRALKNPFLGATLPRFFHLSQGDFRHGLQGIQKQEIIPDTIYLDPMFHTAAFKSGKRHGAPRKEMQIFHEILECENEDEGIEALLQFSLAKARRRVVVKRPLKAPLIPLKGHPPFHSYKGKAIRYDLYITSH